MFAWLRNQGAVFENPLPGSTNYLGAYTALGVLKRSLIPEKKDENNNAVETNSKSESLGGENAIPEESESDLIPFPMNKQFRSQPVVNEAMREDIWEKIMKEGLSVRTVSAQMGVEMSRVGAIVRLKEVEKEWRRTVSF